MHCEIHDYISGSSLLGSWDPASVSEERKNGISIFEVVFEVSNLSDSPHDFLVAVDSARSPLLFLSEAVQFEGRLRSFGRVFELKGSGADVGVAFRMTLVSGDEESSRCRPVERLVRVRGGETLSDVASRCYGEPRHWRLIARANGIVDPLTLELGQRLVIPVLS
jgi:nucleoid-associated protein YgaU